MCSMIMMMIMTMTIMIIIMIIIVLVVVVFVLAGVIVVGARRTTPTIGKVLGVSLLGGFACPKGKKLPQAKPRKSSKNF